jgi:hypothetical protein
MATKEEVIAAAQAVLDAANALEVSAQPTITEVKVENSDGTEEKFSPEVAA